MRNISAKKKAVIAILIICAAVTVFLCFGRAKLIDLENSYAGYVKTGLPYENLIVPVDMELPWHCKHLYRAWRTSDK